MMSDGILETYILFKLTFVPDSAFTFKSTASLIKNLAFILQQKKKHTQKKKNKLNTKPSKSPRFTV